MLRRTAFALVMLAPVSGWGQQLAEQPRVTLSLPVEQVQLIVQTLGQIECRTVTQLASCRTAEAALNAIREQAKMQVK